MPLPEGQLTSKLTDQPAPSDAGGKTSTKELAHCKVKKYAEHHLYILGGRDQDHQDVEAEDPNLEAHYKRCDEFGDFFNDYTKYEVHHFVPDDTMTQEIFDEHWDNQLALHGSNHHLIIAFFGRAYGEDGDHSIVFLEAPDCHINFYDFMHQINNTNTDVQFILDCHIQTRPTVPWERQHAMTELIAMKAGMFDEDGNRIRHRGDYAVTIVRYLKRQIEKYRGQAPIRRERAARSIPQILRSDKEMYDNTHRVWFAKPKPDLDHPETDSPIWRFVIDPVLISRGEPLEIFGLHIQPNPLRLKRLNIAYEIQQDEAIVEDIAPGNEGEGGGDEGEDGDDEEGEDDDEDEEAEDEEAEDDEGYNSDEEMAEGCGTEQHENIFMEL